MPNKIHYLWVRPYKTYVSDRQFLTDVNNFEHENQKSTVVNGSMKFWRVARSNDGEFDVDEITASLNRSFYDFDEDLRWVDGTSFTLWWQ